MTGGKHTLQQNITTMNSKIYMKHQNIFFKKKKYIQMTKRNSKKYDTTIEKKKKPQIINSMQ